MASSIEEIIETFQSVDAETRLDLLLDFSNQLPELPEKYVEARDVGLGRVHECLTPVFLFTEKEDDKIHLIAFVAEEAPTVKGVMAILVEAYSGKTAVEIAKAPLDIVDLLGLAGALRMNRAVGLAAVVMRVRNAAAAAA
jgi:cysteine desulfuration protein SufE